MHMETLLHLFLVTSESVILFSSTSYHICVRVCVCLRALMDTDAVSWTEDWPRTKPQQTEEDQPELAAAALSPLSSFSSAGNIWPVNNV